MASFSGGRLFLERSELTRTSNAVIASATVLVSVAVAVIIFILVDGSFAGSTIVSEAVVICTGQILMSIMIARRSALRRRWGDRAFSVAFRSIAIPGVTLVFAGVVHFGWIEGGRIVPRPIAALPILYLFASGVVLWLRAVMTFGFDNLTLLYVYFPAESRLVQSNVYSVLRHPVYSAILRVIYAIILWNGSPLALIAGCVAPVGMTVWLRLAEEVELIERFGSGYRDYRRRVPAFFNLNPHTWPTLWRFLVKGG